MDQQARDGLQSRVSTNGERMSNEQKMVHDPRVTPAGQYMVARVWQRVRRVFVYLTNLAVDQAKDPALALRLRITNATAVFITIVCILFTLIYTARGDFQMLPTCLPWLIAFSGILALNALGFWQLSRVALLAVGNLSLLTSTWALGTHMHLPLYLLPAVATAYLVFVRRESRLIIFFTVLPVLEYLVMVVWFPDAFTGFQPVPPEIKPLVQSGIVLSAFLLLLVPVVLLFELERRHFATMLSEREQLQQSDKMATLGLMSAGIAHELNNPLAVIGGRLRLLRATSAKARPSDEDLERFLSVLDHQIARIHRIIRSMLAFARDGKLDAPSKVDLRAVVEDTLALCRDRLMERGAAIRVELPTQATEVECRPSEIMQVLINLINNAADAVGEQPVKNVWVILRNIGHLARLEVHDSGPGVPEIVRQKLGQAFITTKGAGKGTGLGLNLSMKIVEQHSGRFFLDALAPNTCFVVELPLASGAKSGTRHDDVA